MSIITEYYDDGYNDAIKDVKNIIKKQPFINFNVNEQYSIRPMITQKEIYGFLEDVLNWVFQSSEGTVRAIEK